MLLARSIQSHYAGTLYRTYARYDGKRRPVKASLPGIGTCYRDKLPMLDVNLGSICQEQYRSVAVAGRPHIEAGPIACCRKNEVVCGSQPSVDDVRRQPLSAAGRGTRIKVARYGTCSRKDRSRAFLLSVGPLPRLAKVIHICILLPRGTVERRPAPPPSTSTSTFSSASTAQHTAVHQARARAR